MGAKISAEMKHALFLVVHEGQPVKASARVAGVNASSVYKALKRMDRASARDLPVREAPSLASLLPRPPTLAQHDAWG